MAPCARHIGLTSASIVVCTALSSPPAPPVSLFKGGLLPRSWRRSRKIILLSTPLPNSPVIAAWDDFLVTSRSRVIPHARGSLPPALYMTAPNNHWSEPRTHSTLLLNTRAYNGNQAVAANGAAPTGVVAFQSTLTCAKATGRHPCAEDFLPKTQALVPARSSALTSPRSLTRWSNPSLVPITGARDWLPSGRSIAYPSRPSVPSLFYSTHSLYWEVIHFHHLSGRSTPMICCFSSQSPVWQTRGFCSSGVGLHPTFPTVPLVRWSALPWNRERENRKLVRPT